MSIASVLDDRYALWFGLLVNDFGYDEAPLSRPPRSSSELAIRAIRPRSGQVEAVVLDIREGWVLGSDSVLGIEDDDCMLEVSSWNAQVMADSGDGTGAERLDVDRRKPKSLWVHRHPFGEVNDRREPAAPLRHPAAWLEHVEIVIAEHYGYLQ
jgi:hypothetical protein